MKVRFGVLADLHVDFMHDATKRFDLFLEDCKAKKVDFCVQLGDFCPPNGVNSSAKNHILKNISRCPVPFYHVLGNHDMDTNCKEDVLQYIGVTESHISFDKGGVHFVILDACCYQVNEEFIHYNHGNYKELPEEAKVPILPPSELTWLENDLKHAQYPTVIFSHQSLVESRAGIQNAEEFRAVIKRAPKGVFAAICGHEHVDRLEQKDGVWYLCINSMSYYWAGSKYKHDTYGSEIVEEFEKLTKVFPYEEPLYAVIEIDDTGISVHGKRTEFVGAAPKELEFEKKGLVDEITPCITEREISFL